MANPAIERIIESLDNDLPRSALFREKVPALAEAFDANRMTQTLHDSLLETSDGRYSILKTVPGKALFLPDYVVNMQFKLTILDRNSDETISTLVNARLFQDLSACQAYLEQTLVPIAARMDGRPETRPFARPVTIIEHLRMILSIFPIDGLIPTLVDTTNPKTVASILAETLPDALSGKFMIKDVNLLPAYYGRYKRCVLRYSVDGIQTETQTPQNLTVYGKVDADGSGALTVSLLSALSETLQKPNIPYRFRIPRSLGYFPQLQLLMMEALPGKPFFKDSLKTWRGNRTESIEEKTSHDGAVTLEQAVQTCALIAATLHGSNIEIGRQVTLDVHVSELLSSAEVISQIFPALSAQVKSWIEQTVEFARTSPAMFLCFSHGDFTYTQLLFDGEQAGLVDFDSMCQAEPAQDLGHYLAYQRLNIIKGQDPNAPFAPEAIERLSDLFLDTYIKASKDWIADEGLLRRRVAIYELISLIRLTLHSWEKMKGSRLKQTILLLEERIEGQKQNHLSVKNKMR